MANFQGFTLVPWQKVDRICLGFAQNACYISNPFLPFPRVFERYGTEAKTLNFSSLIWFPNTLFFIQAFQNATFGVKNTAVSQKLSKLASILVYFLPLLAQMWKKSAKISDFFILWKLWDFLICKILTSKQFFWPKIKDFARELNELHHF